jgi:hypothetical protein
MASTFNGLHIALTKEQGQLIDDSDVECTSNKRDL